VRFRPCVLAHPLHRCAILTVRIRTHPGQGVVVSARFPKGGWSYPHTPRMGGRGAGGGLLAPGPQFFNFFGFSTFLGFREKNLKFWKFSSYRDNFRCPPLMEFFLLQFFNFFWGLGSSPRWWGVRLFVPLASILRFAAGRRRRLALLGECTRDFHDGCREPSPASRDVFPCSSCRLPSSRCSALGTRYATSCWCLSRQLEKSWGAGVETAHPGLSNTHNPFEGLPTSKESNTFPAREEITRNLSRRITEDSVSPVWTFVQWGVSSFPWNCLEILPANPGSVLEGVFWNSKIKGVGSFFGTCSREKVVFDFAWGRGRVKVSPHNRRNPCPLEIKGEGFVFSSGLDRIAPAPRSWSGPAAWPGGDPSGGRWRPPRSWRWCRSWLPASTGRSGQGSQLSFGAW